MITVCYDRDSHSITVDGHAQSGEPGHDLVCSAVTTLVYTAAVALANDVGAGALKPGTTMELGKGHAELRWEPAEGCEDVVALQLDTVCAGFDFLANNLGEYVEYKLSDGATH